jgi:hypothetical protein
MRSICCSRSTARFEHAQRDCACRRTGKGGDPGPGNAIFRLTYVSPYEAELSLAVQSLQVSFFPEEKMAPPTCKERNRIKRARTLQTAYHCCCPYRHKVGSERPPLIPHTKELRTWVNQTGLFVYAVLVGIGVLDPRKDPSREWFRVEISIPTPPSALVSPGQKVLICKPKAG